MKARAFQFTNWNYCFYIFPPKTNVIENQPCVFLPTDITTVHIVTNEHYEMHRLTQKQGNKNKTKTVLPFPPFLYSGTGSITPLHCPVSQSPLCSFMHFCPTPQTHSQPDQSNPDSEVLSFSCFSWWNQPQHLSHICKSVFVCE